MRHRILGLASLCLLQCLSYSVSAREQLPEFYRQVNRVHWVVKDLEQVTHAWNRLGFSEIVQHGKVELSETVFRGYSTPAKILWASGRLANLQVEWIQPLEGKNAYTEFLSRHGSGVFSLVHQVPTVEALHRELERLRKLGVGVLQREMQDSDHGPIHYAYLDTDSIGGVTLELLWNFRE